MQTRSKTHILNSEVIKHQNKLPRGGEDLPSLDIFKSRLDGFLGWCWRTPQGSKRRELGWGFGAVRKAAAAVSPAFESVNLKHKLSFAFKCSKNK